MAAWTQVSRQAQDAELAATLESMFGFRDLASYRIVEIRDVAAALTEVTAELRFAPPEPPVLVTANVIFEDEEGSQWSVGRGLASGESTRSPHSDNRQPSTRCAPRSRMHRPSTRDVARLADEGDQSHHKRPANAHSRTVTRDGYPVGLATVVFGRRDGLDRPLTRWALSPPNPAAAPIARCSRGTMHMSRLNASWPPAEPVPFRPRRFLRTRRGLITVGVLSWSCWPSPALPGHPSHRDRPHGGHARAVPDRPGCRGAPGTQRCGPGVRVDAGASAVRRRRLDRDPRGLVREQLTSRGWEPGAGASAIVSTGLAVCAWHTDKDRLRLGFWQPDKWHALEPDGPDYASVYEVVIIATGTTYNGAECADSPLRYWTPSPAP